MIPGKNITARRLRMVPAVVVVALCCSIVACASRLPLKTPQGIATMGLQILSGIEIVQNSVIEAEKAGFISEERAASVLVQVRTITMHAQQLPPALRALEAATDATRAEHVNRSRAIAYTMSQLLAALTLPGDLGARIGELLRQVNDILLRLSPGSVAVLG